MQTRLLKPSVNLIVAMSQNHVIGQNNQLPWHLPEDLQFFKRTTLGYPIVMGRNTHESIGRPLPGRRNIIVTRNSHYQAAGCDIVHSLPAAIGLCYEHDHLFVIGGGQLYSEALLIADRLYVTEIKHDFSGDTFFPVFEDMGFVETQRQTHQALAPNTFTFDFVIYERSNKRMGPPLISSFPQ